MLKEKINKSCYPIKKSIDGFAHFNAIMIFATLPYTKSVHKCAQNNFANAFSALSGQTFFFRRNPILLCL